MINVNVASKNLAFNMVYTKKTIQLLYFFKKYGLIKTFNVSKVSSNNPIIRVYLSYHRDLRLCQNIKLISTPSRSFYISLKAIKLVDKRTLGSIFILSTNKGLITHKEALLHKTGGKLIGFFSV
jgi:ribosomal protein S8